MTITAQSLKGAFLVELEADAPDGTVDIQRWGFGDLTYEVDATEYTCRGLIEQLSLTSNPLDLLGGAAPLQGECSVTLINTARESDKLDELFISNDDLRVYYLEFVPASDGTETVVRHLLYKGVVSSRPYNANSWTIRARSITTRLFRDFPQALITPAIAPFANPDLHGKPQPIAFGNMTLSPFDGQGRVARLAPCYSQQDQAVGDFTAGSAAYLSRGRAYEFISEGGQRQSRYWEILDQTRSGEIVRVTTNRRRLRTYPAFSTLDNTVREWHNIADGDLSTSIDLGNDDLLSLHFEAESDEGDIETQQIVVVAGSLEQAQTPTFTIREGDRTVLGPIEVTTAGDDTWTADLPANEQNWNTSRLSIEFDRQVRVFEVYLQTTFLRQRDNRTPVLAQKVEGIDPNDIDSRFGVFGDHPASHILQILHLPSMMDIPLADIDVGSFRAVIDKWPELRSAFALTEAQTPEHLSTILSNFGFSLITGIDGKLKLLYPTKEDEPVLALIGDRHSIEGVGQWGGDNTEEDSIINELAIQYAQDPLSKQYGKSTFNSSVAKQKGGGRIELGVLVADRDLLSPRVGDKLYTTSGQWLRVAALHGNSQRVYLEDERGLGVEDENPVEWSLGENLSGEAFRSHLRHKVRRSIGGIEPSLTNSGLYQHSFIYHEEDIERWVSYVLEWHSIRRTSVRCVVQWQAQGLEKGDCVFFDHPALPPSQGAVEVGAVTDGNIESNDVRIPTYGADVFGVGDYLLIDSELVKVRVRHSTGLLVERGVLGTTAESHVINSRIRRMETKFLVVNKTLIDPLANLWELVLMGYPPYFQHRPRLATDSEASAAATARQATTADRRKFHHFSNASGLFFEQDSASLGHFFGHPLLQTQIGFDVETPQFRTLGNQKVPPAVLLDEEASPAKLKLESRGGRFLVLG